MPNQAPAAIRPPHRHGPRPGPRPPLRTPRRPALLLAATMAALATNACREPLPSARVIPLDQGWTLAGVDTFTAPIPATVPGTPLDPQTLAHQCFPAQRAGLLRVDVGQRVLGRFVPPAKAEDARLAGAFAAAEHLDHALARFRPIELPRHPGVPGRAVFRERVEVPGEVALHALLLQDRLAQPDRAVDRVRSRA